MSSGLYNGASGLALGSGLYRQVSGLYGGASGLVSHFGSSNPVIGVPFTTTVTVGFDPTGGGDGPTYGLNPVFSIGSTSPTHFLNDPGMTITYLYWLDDGVSFPLILYCNGWTAAFDAWTTLTVAGVPYLRVAGNQVTDNATYASWWWTVPVNPFPTPAAQVAVAFT
jgi:hypothetical protein